MVETEINSINVSSQSKSGDVIHLRLFYSGYKQSRRTAMKIYEYNYNCIFILFYFEAEISPAG